MLRISICVAHSSENGCLPSSTGPLQQQQQPSSLLQLTSSPPHITSAGSAASAPTSASSLHQQSSSVSAAGTSLVHHHHQPSSGVTQQGQTQTTTHHQQPTSRDVSTVTTSCLPKLWGRVRIVCSLEVCLSPVRLRVNSTVPVLLFGEGKLIDI